MHASIRRTLAAACTSAACLAAAPAAAQDDASHLSAVWRGSYLCAQGITGLELELRGNAHGIVHGVFRFYPLAENPDVPVGAYPVIGRLDHGGGLVLRPVDAPDLPGGYVPVGLQAVVHEDSRRLDGWVHGPGCAGLAVEREGRAGAAELPEGAYGTQRWGRSIAFGAARLSLDERERPARGGSTARMWLRMQFLEGEAAGQVEEYEVEYDCPGRLARVWSHVVRDPTGAIVYASLSPDAFWQPVTAGEPNAAAYARACAR